MIGKVFGLLVLIAFTFGVLSGNVQELSRAAANSAKEALELAISLAGSMCLWNGVARVLDKCGFSQMLRRFISPILSKVYPDAYKKNNGINECAANISANFLGLGNAALPLGIRAMKRFSENDIKNPERASDDAVMFAVLATTPFQLLPVTLATMREACGSASPYEILVPVWICEIVTTVFAVIICKMMAKIFK